MSAPARTAARRPLPARLLEAGRRLSATGGLAALEPAAIAAEAGLKPGTFQRYFATAEAYRCALMEQIADEVRDSLAKNTLNMAPGLQRMKLAIESYLAANVERPLLRELVLHLRADPAGEHAIRRRIIAFTIMMELELKSLRWPRAAAAARLITAAVIEISMAEYEARRPLPDHRATLYTYLERATA